MQFPPFFTHLSLLRVEAQLQKSNEPNLQLTDQRRPGAGPGEAPDFRSLFIPRGVRAPQGWAREARPGRGWAAPGECPRVGTEGTGGCPLPTGLRLSPSQPGRGQCGRAAGAGRAGRGMACHLLAQVCLWGAKACLVAASPQLMSPGAGGEVGMDTPGSVCYIDFGKTNKL